MPAPSTVRDVITAAMLDLGAIASGEAPTAAEARDALRRLNLMIDQWRLQSLMVYSMTPVTVPQTGQASYAIGPGGDVDIPRPVRLDLVAQRLQAGSAYPIDRPLALIDSWDEWAALAVKNLATTVATSFFYDSGFPVGLLYTWPILTSGETLILYPWQPLQGFETLEDVVQLPPGYELALQTNLSLHLAPMFRDSSPTDLLVNQAYQGIELIKVGNYQAQLLAMPAGMPLGHGSRTGTDRAGFLSGWLT